MSEKVTSRVNQLRNENGSEVPVGTTFHFIRDTFNVQVNVDFTFPNICQDFSSGNECSPNYVSFLQTNTFQIMWIMTFSFMVQRVFLL